MAEDASSIGTTVGEVKTTSGIMAEDVSSIGTVNEVKTTSAVGATDVIGGMVAMTSVGASGMEDVRTMYISRERPSTPIDSTETSKKNTKDASTSLLVGMS